MTLSAGALLLALLCPLNALPQRDLAEETVTPAATANIFSGLVISLTADSITVVRKVPAKDDVSRTFARDAQTKVEGHPLKLNARVTVRFQGGGEKPLQALHIIVR